MSVLSTTPRFVAGPGDPDFVLNTRYACIVILDHGDGTVDVTAFKLDGTTTLRANLQYFTVSSRPTDHPVPLPPANGPYVITV